MALAMMNPCPDVSLPSGSINLSGGFTGNGSNAPCASTRCGTTNDFLVLLLIILIVMIGLKK